ncbi:Protein of unknown function [Nakamurella panacisegetis]|uniref:DUF3180 domain-containing protein n=1 Tax=Nakamurella panacisegetis TaxID=1090615 RepID=A0A1H0NP57_9ACTN|nr:DUF3180 domain-containing protein [Nakamurella panacisegetis]SDO94443.1 Protein of unknown function [Nakamurella panacisegetis]
MSADPGTRLGSTRPRDLLAVALVAAIAAYLLVRFNYRHIPPLPRFAGVTAAVLGIGEALFGNGLRTRIQADRSPDAPASRRPVPPPVPPLVAARAVMTAKATALAGAAAGGLWIGLLAYVLPNAGVVAAARSDAITAALGLVSAVVMCAGALYLEFCCRAPD